MQKQQKNNIGIIEGHSLLCRKNDFDTNRFFFRRLNECVGVAITLKDGSIFLYHKSGPDDIRSIKEILQQNLQPENIKSIKLIGGNITNCCIPLEGSKIYKKGDIQNKKEYRYQTKKNYSYQNLIFRIPKSDLEDSDELKQNHQGSIYNIFEDEANLETDPLIRIDNLTQNINKNHYVAQAIAEDGEFYCMDVDKIENLRGIRNIYEMKKMLKELFPDVNPEHNFCQRFSSIEILSNGDLIQEKDHNIGGDNIVPIYSIPTIRPGSASSNNTIYHTYSVIPFCGNDNKKPLSSDMINIETENNGNMRLNYFLKILQNNTKSEFKIMNIEFPKIPANTKIMYSRLPTKSIQKSMAEILAQNDDYSAGCFSKKLDIKSVGNKIFAINDIRKVYMKAIQKRSNRVAPM